MTEPCDFDTIVREETPQAERIAEYFADQYGSARVLDIGCGPGIYVTAMRAKSLDAYGIDQDDRMPKGLYFEKWDVTNIIPYHRLGDVFQLVLSLEVGEHIEEDLSDDYLLCIQSTGANVVYFSAARPLQGGHGHINCQPKSYWVKKFHRRGYWLDPDETDKWIGFMRQGYHMGWLLQNGLVFRRYSTSK
jgi:SAM-dependent methyltransferase